MLLSDYQQEIYVLSNNFNIFLKLYKPQICPYKIVLHRQKLRLVLIQSMNNIAMKFQFDAHNCLLLSSHVQGCRYREQGKTREFT
jgi:hypothetical protein